MVLKLVNRISDGIEFVGKWLSFVGVFVVCICLILQVFFRYVLRSPLVWTEELARYVYVWTMFTGLAFTSYHHLDARVTFITDLFPKKVYDSVAICCELICALCFLMVIPVSIKFVGVQSKLHWISLPNLTLDVVWLAIPVGAILASLSYLLNTVKMISKLFCSNEDL